MLLGQLKAGIPALYKKVLPFTEHTFARFTELGAWRWIRLWLLKGILGVTQLR